MKAKRTLNEHQTNIKQMEIERKLDKHRTNEHRTNIERTDVQRMSDTTTTTLQNVHEL